jgi:hypothetical protein
MHASNSSEHPILNLCVNLKDIGSSVSNLAALANGTFA